MTLTLLARIDHLRKLAEAEQNGKTIEYNYSDTQWGKIACSVNNDKHDILEAPEKFRIKPEPVTRPWNGPEDVPGPVCWIRIAEHDEKANTLEAMITAISDKGISLVGPGDSLRFYSWSRVSEISHRTEHSTDRKTWHKCEITEES